MSRQQELNARWRRKLKRTHAQMESQQLGDECKLQAPELDAQIVGVHFQDEDQFSAAVKTRWQNYLVNLKL